MDIGENKRLSPVLGATDNWQRQNGGRILGSLQVTLAFPKLKTMHSSLPCSILCQLTATTCGASVFFNLLLC